MCIGVRAMVVDKTMDPKWNPSKIENITNDKVESFFAKLPDNEELKL